MAQRFESAPIEEAGATLEAGHNNNPRQRAASELRQLRALFTQTGFGDALSVPDDFESRVQNAQTPLAPARTPVASYNPEVLDLLLNLATYKAHGVSTEWPASVVRARSKEELAEIAQSRRRFDVIVADDAVDVGQTLLDALAADGAVVHRIGVADEDAIFLDVPHRQQDAELASLASGQPSRWLGAPDGIGLIVRTAPDLTIDQLISAGDRLVQALRNSGCVAFPATSDAEADFIVASLEELKDPDLQSLATRARKGVAVLCRSDGRTVGSLPQVASSPEVMLAQSLGWKLVSMTTDGALLEKDGRSAVLVDESIVMDGRDETIVDVAHRIGAMGWHPIVSWRSASRTPEDLGKLLNDRAITTNRRYRTLAETFDLKAPEPPGSSTGFRAARHRCSQCAVDRGSRFTLRRSVGVRRWIAAQPVRRHCVGHV